MTYLKQTYITRMPDKAGAFLKASRVISDNGGNIVRVNYNKAVDAHTLFIEVNATKEQHTYIERMLSELGYLTDRLPEQKVILIVLKLADIVDSIRPVLEIISEYDINVSYISSQENGTPYQNFKMGLTVDNTAEVQHLLEDISRICEVKIIDYDVTEHSLDNTVFYLTFASEMREILSLSQSQANEVIINSNRIMQMLDERNETPFKTFDYIKQFASFVVAQKGDNFAADISTTELSENITLFTVEPPCGSNTYIMKSGNDLIFIDCGFACYEAEMNAIFIELFDDISAYRKSLIITHADIDHTGLSKMFETIYMSKSCYENFCLEHNGCANFREQNILHAPYCKLSKIISEYTPPILDKCKIIGKKEDNSKLSHIGALDIAGIHFEMYEGNGGHVKGETVIVCEQFKLVFTGDILVNVNGFSDKQRQFNALAPYLMTSVNVDSHKAKELRQYITDKYKGYRLCTGHGATVEN